MNGSGTFNGKILIDKLAKLNSSQQSIETLSHWCIFHRKKADQVVETWERQFYCSPRDQRVSFLYLANDILQNSRRKGMEFVGEFWKVLPDALHDVIENGDDSGKKAALRLVDIWEERKVFSPRGQSLKEDFLGSRNGRSISYKLVTPQKQPAGDIMDKLISSYQLVCDGSDEGTLRGKCEAAISSTEKMEKEVVSDLNAGKITEPGFAGELRTLQGLIRECIDQMKVCVSSRTTLVSHLREATNEHEFKLEGERNQLQVLQLLDERVGRQLTGAPTAPPPPPPPDLDEIPPPPPDSAYSEAPPPPNFPPAIFTDTAPVTTDEEQRKLAAADVAAKLTSSTSSAQMLSYVLSNLASEGAISQSMSEEFSSDANKKPRIDNGGFGNVSYYLPQLQQPPQPLPHPDSMHQQGPPLMPPMLGPIPPSVPFNYGSPPMPAFPMMPMSPYSGLPNPFSFQASDAASGAGGGGSGGSSGSGGGFFGQPQFPVATPPNSQK